MALTAGSIEFRCIYLLIPPPLPPPYSDLISDSGEIGMGSAGRLPFHAGWCQGEEKEAVGGKCRPVTPWHKWRRSTFPALLFIWFSSFILEFLSVSISPPPPSLPPNPPLAPPTLSPPPLLSMSLWYHCVPDPAYHSTIFHLKRGGGGEGQIRWKHLLTSSMMALS